MEQNNRRKIVCFCENSTAPINFFLKLQESEIFDISIIHFIPIPKQLKKLATHKNNILLKRKKLPFKEFNKKINFLKSYEYKILTKEYKIKKEKAIKRMNKIYSQTIPSIEQILKEKKPDFVFIFNENNFMMKGIDFICKNNNIPTIYMEKGVFGILTFDKKGTNVSLTVGEKEKSFFKNMKIEKPLEKVNEQIKKIKKIKKEEVHSDIKFKIEYLIRFLGLKPRYNFFPRSGLNRCIKEIKSAIKRIKSQKNRPEKIDLPNKFVFFPLQIPTDTQAVLYEKLKPEIAIKELLKNLPSEYKVIIKEHPLYKNQYKFKEKIIKDDKVMWLRGGNLNELILKSEATILSNSTTAIEALILNKKVITYGCAAFNNVCFHLKSKEQFKKIPEILKYQQTKKDLHIKNNFLYYYFFEQSIPLPFMAKDVTNISKEINKRLNKLKGY